MEPIPDVKVRYQQFLGSSIDQPKTPVSDYVSQGCLERTSEKNGAAELSHLRFNHKSQFLPRQFRIVSFCNASFHPKTIMAMCLSLASTPAVELTTRKRYGRILAGGAFLVRIGLLAQVIQRHANASRPAGRAHDRPGGRPVQRRHLLRPALPRPGFPARPDRRLE